VRSNVDDVHNIKYRKVSLVTPVGRQSKELEVGDTTDGIFKKVLILKDSTNDIDSTVGLQEAGYLKQFLPEENSYLFTNLTTGDQRKYDCREDGLYHLVDNEIKIYNLNSSMSYHHKAMGHQNGEYMKKSLSNNIYSNVSVDPNLIDDEFKTAIHSCNGCLQGKSTKGIKDHRDNLHRIDYDNQDYYTLFGDVMFIDKVPWLILQISKVKWISVYNMIDNTYTGKMMMESIHHLVTIMYNRFNIDIKQLRFDSETRLIIYEIDLNLMGIELLTSPSGIHVNRIESVIRRFKEKYRSIIMSLPFKMNQKYSQYLVNEVCYISNHISDGINLTPFELVYKMKPDIAKLTNAIFGEPIACVNPIISNKMISRVDTGIMLGHKINGTVWIDKFSNKEVVNRYQVIRKLEMTKDIISYLNDYDNQRSFNINVVLNPGQLYNDDENEATLSHSSYTCGNVMKSGVLADVDETIVSSSDYLVSNIAIFGKPTTDSFFEEEISTDNLGPSISRKHPNDFWSGNMSGTLQALQMNYKKSCSVRLQETNQALKNEIMLLDNRKAIIPTTSEESNDVKTVVNIMTRFVHKYKNGNFEKVKCRLLLLGNEIAKYYDDRPSEIEANTISLTSIFVIIGLSAKFNLKRLQIDFTGAFLYATLPVSDQVTALLNVEQTRSYLEVHPEYESFKLKDGTMLVHVVKALYGHPVSPKAWLDKITADLLLCGISNLSCDKCLFVSKDSSRKFYLTLYVDDMFITYEHDDDCEKVLKMCRDKYGQFTVDKGKNNLFTYLHMNIQFDDEKHCVYIDQKDYYEELIEKYSTPSSKVITLPHMMQLSEHYDDQLEGSDPDKKRMLSVVMALFWASRRSRPDILFNVSYLATRTKYATARDLSDLNHLLLYLKSTINDKVCLCFKGEVIASIFVDSSAQFYSDFRGHGGYIASIGEGYGGVVEIKSGKSKSNCRSTMEYELIELHHCLPAILWLRMLLGELGFIQDKASIIYEDNQAVLDIMIRGQVSSGVSRYILAKYYYTKDLVAKGLVRLVHCPTTLMIADIVTKNLPGTVFNCIKNILFNNTLVSTDKYQLLLHELDINEEVYLNNLIVNMILCHI